MKRRQFIQQSSSLLASSIFLSRTATWESMLTTKPLGLQLFTLFNIIDQDVPGNLKKVADLGIKELESAFSFKPMFYGYTGKEFKSLTNNLGLNWVSHHVMGAPLKPRPGFDASKMPKFLTLKTDASQIVDNVAEAGIKYLVCANIPIESKSEVSEAVDTLGKSAELAKKAGLTFCYHNRDAEFKVVDGQRAFDVFSSQISSDLMKFELDLGWATKAGENIVELFKKQPGRFPLCHIKDFDADFKNIVPVGQGIVNYEPIFKAASIGGLQHYFLEHDMPKDAFESIRLGKSALDKIL